MAGLHDGVSRVWILRMRGGLDLEGFNDEREAIDRLIRRALLAGVTREKIEATVAKALKHLDEDEPRARESPLAARALSALRPGESFTVERAAGGRIDEDEGETCPRCGLLDCSPECIAAEQAEEDAYDGPRPRKFA